MPEIDVRERVFVLLRNTNMSKDRPLHLLKAALLTILSREEAEGNRAEHRLECVDPEDEKAVCERCERLESEKERIEAHVQQMFIEVEQFILELSRPIYGKSPIQTAIEARAKAEEEAVKTVRQAVEVKKMGDPADALRYFINKHRNPLENIDKLPDEEKPKPPYEEQES